MRWQDKPTSKNIEDRSGDTRSFNEKKREWNKQIREERERKRNKWKKYKEEEWKKDHKDNISLDDYLDREWKKAIDKIKQKEKERKQKEKNEYKPSLDELLDDLSKRSQLKKTQKHEKKVRLISIQKNDSNHLIPEKGPERVERDLNYNPFDVDNNGFEDLMGEAHLFKTSNKRLRKAIADAGRQKHFPSLFETEMA